MKPLWVSWTLSPQSIWPSDKLITNDRMTFDGRSSQIWIFLTLPLVLLLFSRPDGNPICQCGSCCHQICQHRAVLSYVQERHALWIGAYTTWQHFSGGQDFWTGKESCWGCRIHMSPKWMPPYVWCSRREGKSEKSSDGKFREMPDCYNQSWLYTCTLSDYREAWAGLLHHQNRQQKKET